VKSPSPAVPVPQVSTSGGSAMLRCLAQSVFGVPSRRPRRRYCPGPVAAMELLEDRALLSASCVSSCVASCAPRCASSSCSPSVCNTGPVCFSIQKLLCAIQQFEQTLCQSSCNSSCEKSCDSCQNCCDGGGKSCSGNCESGGSCQVSSDNCSSQSTCGSSRAAA